MSALLPGGAAGARGAPRRLRAAFFPVALVALVAIGGWLGAQLDPAGWDPGARIGPMWIALAAVYAVLLALPFVPAIEIGLALMLVLGTDGVLLVYLGTQVGLALGYAGGRMLPASTVAAFAATLRRRGAEPAVVRACNRFDARGDGSQAGWFARALRHRYVALAFALNAPGNAAVGGAGGLAFLAGASRLFSFPRYCALVAAATSPLPALLLLRAV